MTLEELKELLDENLICDYRITTAKNGQVIIYTGLAEDAEGELVSLDELGEAAEIDEEDEEIEEEDDE